ncbi:MAG TPA: ABC transporter ATP-binding protein, partial [Bacillota bacterium]|nr:ABC transporter ATP-binding protein [Bacillota bacterium]
QNPTILILDEATSHIDTETEDIIQRGIERLSKGRTTLIIAHRLSTIRHASMIYVLDQGEIVEAGSHAELLAQGGLFAHMVETQTRQAG